jgi:hypothetical protein
MLWTSQRPTKRAMRRFYAVYASAEMMKVLPEPGRNDPMRAKSVVRSAQARGGCPAHAGRVRPAACSFCMSLRSAWSLHIQIRPSSAPGSAICNRARWRGCVSYFTLAAFSGRAAAPRPREGLGVDPDQVVNALREAFVREFGDPGAGRSGPSCSRRSDIGGRAGRWLRGVHQMSAIGTSRPSLSEPWQRT